MTELKQVDEYVWEIPKSGDMNVPARIYGDNYIINQLKEEDEKQEWNPLKQLKNVAALPGIEKHVLALSDVHAGYGNVIGGVMASDLEEGVITFGSIGFDINCGLHTLKTSLSLKDIEGKKEELAEALFKNVPAGLGSTGKLRMDLNEIDEVLVKGAKYSVEKGFGTNDDLKHLEENGVIEGAKPENVSMKAKQRQFKQIGTLGSGNHYLEVQIVEKVFDEKTAKAFGLFEGQVIVSVHCGSRGLGHQIGTDYLQELDKATKKYGIKIKDKELVCAPIQSEEGQKYFSAVKAGINTAFANRQTIAHLTRETFEKVLGVGETEVKTLYGIGHNTAKVEEHKVGGKTKKLLVQRKGSTRGFGPGREEIPEDYRSAGQPIIVGGTMGTHSYILAGTEKAMQETFGSTVHGAGRTMSRVKAMRQWRGEKLVEELKSKGITVKGHSWKSLAEEAPGAYKEIDSVIDVMHSAGISTKVVKVRPWTVIKG